MTARGPLASTLMACVLIGLFGCSRSGPATVGASHAPARQDPAPVACDAPPVKLTDVAGILVAPIIKLNAVSGDAQSCEYSTGHYPAIMISVRPGLGQSTVDAWTAGRMPLKASPIGGIGDAAVWQASLHEVIAQRGNLLCDVQLRGDAIDIAIPVEALPGALGALCNRIFAG